MLGDVWSCVDTSVLLSLKLSFPLKLVLQWLDIRDMFLGLNNAAQDIGHALDLCRDCAHPDARRLSDFFCGQRVTSSVKVCEVLQQPHLEDDSLALFLLAVLLQNQDRNHLFSLIRRAAERGCAAAQARLSCTEGQPEQRLMWARRAAEQGERDGFAAIGMCMLFEGDKPQAKHNFLIAALMGDRASIVYMAHLLQDDPDPSRWYWMG